MPLGRTCAKDRRGDSQRPSGAGQVKLPGLDRSSFMCPLTQTLSSWIHALEKAHPMTPRGHQQDRPHSLMWRKRQGAAGSPSWLMDACCCLKREVWIYERRASLALCS